MIQIRTLDQSTAGMRIEGPSLSLPSAVVTIRELITFRVQNEVERYNWEKPEKYYGLVQPTDVETVLNGPSKRAFKPIQVDKQIEAALQAFEKQRIIVLTPKGQAESLDDTVSLFDGDEVSFLRLVPLVGG